MALRSIMQMSTSQTLWRLPKNCRQKYLKAKLNTARPKRTLKRLKRSWIRGLGN